MAPPASIESDARPMGGPQPSRPGPGGLPTAVGVLVPPQHRALRPAPGPHHHLCVPGGRLLHRRPGVRDPRGTGAAQWRWPIAVRILAAVTEEQQGRPRQRQPEEVAAQKAGDEERLMRGENPDTTYLEDAEHWSGVYKELLA